MKGGAPYVYKYTQKKKQRIASGIFWPLAIAIEPSEGTPESWLKMAVDEI